MLSSKIGLSDQFDCQWCTYDISNLRPSHATTETAKNAVIAQFHALIQLFFTTATIFPTVFIMDNNFLNDFFENLCGFSCSLMAQCYVSNESILFCCRFDIYDPVFTQQTYKFELDLSKAVVGYVVGQVQASDNDNGDGGIVVYELVSYSEYFSKLRSEIGPLVSNVSPRESQCLLYRAVHVFLYNNSL